MGEAIFMAFICWFCALIFIVLGIYAWKKESPMHFWSGSTVKAEEIKDIKGYNKANGLMWITYGSIFIIAGLLGLFGLELLSIIIIGLASMPGLFSLIFIYYRIYNKYKKGH